MTASYSHSISIQTNPTNCNCSLQIARALRKTGAGQLLFSENFRFSGYQSILFENHIKKRLITNMSLNKNEISVDFIE